MTAQGKIGIAVLIISATTFYMVYVGSSSTWQYFLSVEECLRDAPTLVGQRIRVSGTICRDSLEHSPDGTHTGFVIQDSNHKLTVRCSCQLPDNLAEDMPVVVEGFLDRSGKLAGEKVLTRCASKYQAVNCSNDSVYLSAPSASGSLGD
ncbi:MAG: cytochrome c maturation protein CcmE [Planctomycetales bacterium]|nr:cytochrome c maturation protein CcmE [Planctomycetales bacterium]